MTSNNLLIFMTGSNISSYTLGYTVGTTWDINAKPSSYLYHYVLLNCQFNWNLWSPFWNGGNLVFMAVPMLWHLGHIRHLNRKIMTLIDDWLTFTGRHFCYGWLRNTFLVSSFYRVYVLNFNNGNHYYKTEFSLWPSFYKRGKVIDCFKESENMVILKEKVLRLSFTFF